MKKKKINLKNKNRPLSALNTAGSFVTHICLSSEYTLIIPTSSKRAANVMASTDVSIVETDRAIELNKSSNASGETSKAGRRQSEYKLSVIRLETTG